MDAMAWRLRRSDRLKGLRAVVDSPRAVSVNVVASLLWTPTATLRQVEGFSKFVGGMLPYLGLQPVEKLHSAHAGEMDGWWVGGGGGGDDHAHRRLTSRVDDYVGYTNNVYRAEELVSTLRCIIFCGHLIGSKWFPSS